MEPRAPSEVLQKGLPQLVAMPWPSSSRALLRGPALARHGASSRSFETSIPKMISFTVPALHSGRHWRNEATVRVVKDRREETRAHPRFVALEVGAFCRPQRRAVFGRGGHTRVRPSAEQRAKRSGGEGASPEEAPFGDAAPRSSPPPHPRLLRRLAAFGRPSPRKRGEAKRRPSPRSPFLWQEVRRARLVRSALRLGPLPMLLHLVEARLREGPALGG